ncbi:MAG: tetratricopeptide repeat protein, partial [Ignavibacteria bacterium]|nr:tetratricopeptide repeat protein [Ignavibacteria bacterium]
MEIYESYSKSEMGRSMTKLDRTNIIEEYPQSIQVYDSVGNFFYEMLQRDGQFYQREYRLDKNGNVEHERVLEAEYVIGSGNNLRMYFHDENGMLYELPLTWYVHKKHWDLSPGYRDFGNLRFSRYAGAKCIACHNSYLKESKTMIDRYVEPFTLGISCERCHGPGELHVQRMIEIKEEDVNAPTIVNPRKLPPQEQLDVCRQCHLLGSAWALHGESDWFDFRPGMKLENHRSVYFPKETRKEVFLVGDSPQRLSLSRCFKASNGTLTCITCHDPHFSIKTFTEDHYNQKCKQCHPVASLSGKPLEYSHTTTDNCVPCHMNRTGRDNTLHGVSNTDHWIRVDANKTAVDWSILKQPIEKQPITTLIPHVDANDGGAAMRRGIAYLDYFKNRDNRTAYLDSSLAYLTAGLHLVENNSRGHFNMGEVQGILGHYDEAVASLNRAVDLKPDYAEAYYELGRIYTVKQQVDMAINYYRMAVQHMPDEPTFLEGLGMALADGGYPEEAARILEKSLQVDKQNPRTYHYLGNLYAISFQQPEKALSYYQRSVVLEPDSPKVYINLGNTFTLLGKYTEAVKSYKRELRYQPKSPEVFVNLGRVYALMGK